MNHTSASLRSLAIADASPTPTSREIRAELGHPIVDSDFHSVEFGPLFEDYISHYGGPGVVDRYRASTGYENDEWYGLSASERRRQRLMRPPWWPIPAKNTKDLATICLPRLLHERLEECGTDFVVVHPNAALFAVSIMDEDLRRPLIRAVNRYSADLFGPYSDRIAPVAAIPMQSPEEAVEELRWAVHECGLKVGLIPGSLPRGSGIYGQSGPFWLDTFGLDTESNYDLFWEEVVALGVPLATHAGGMGWTSRNSCSSFMYNHIGHFASGAEALCKSLFLSGVTKRFPALRVAFLEGGALWAVSLFSELIGRWEQRNDGVVDNYDPARVDAAALRAYFAAFADDNIARQLEANSLPLHSPLCYSRNALKPPRSEDRDEFAQVEIQSVADIADHFIPNFYFGAESHDATVVHAFDTRVNPLGRKLNAIWASDCGHFDSPDIASSLAEAWEMVSSRAMSREDFSALVYHHPKMLYESANPRFFEKTAVQAKW